MAEHSQAIPARGVAPGRGRFSRPTGLGGGGAFRSWPLMLLAVPAAVAVWSGWVQLGQMTGFGLVRPFPGLWDSVQVNTAITLPIGVEAYAAYALGTWLSASFSGPSGGWRRGLAGITDRRNCRKASWDWRESVPGVRTMALSLLLAASRASRLAAGSAGAGTSASAWHADAASAARTVSSATTRTSPANPQRGGRPI